MVKLICSLAVLISPLFCFPQKKDSVIHSVSVSNQYTSILAERAPASYFSNDHPWILQADIGWLKINQKAWNYCHCYTQNGVSLSYINFDNPSKLGRAFTVTGFIEPYLFHSKTIKLSLVGKAGIAFLDKLYDSLTNRENVFFSTNLSFALGVGANASFRLSDRIYIKTGFQLNHISNGGRKDPNDGMNFAGFQAVLEYRLQTLSLPQQKKERFTDKKFGLMVHLFGNQRTAWATPTFAEERKLVLGLNAGLIKRIGRLNGIGVGGEFYYDGINSVYSQRYNTDTATEIAAVNVQHYLFFGKLLFGQQLGWYVTNNTGYQKNLFQRYILEYEFKKNWYAGFSLKSHGDISDYFAFSAGYFFRL